MNNCEEYGVQIIKYRFLSPFSLSSYVSHYFYSSSSSSPPPLLPPRLPPPPPLSHTDASQAFLLSPNDLEMPLFFCLSIAGDKREPRKGRTEGRQERKEG
ncbi:hypothetical protein E2C01_026272 [Portunus trituberculatus]|uniref:Uncharacterized protein n=1 Tax=Portunus trituberculatus TaxID=210409 RepID=A0A5B7EI44_PORTR|nr:hypothetical protein [Portunus trituberculatus]